MQANNLIALYCFLNYLIISECVLHVCLIFSILKGFGIIRQALLQTIVHPSNKAWVAMHLMKYFSV